MHALQSKYADRITEELRHAEEIDLPSQSNGAAPVVRANLKGNSPSSNGSSLNGAGRGHDASSAAQRRNSNGNGAAAAYTPSSSYKQAIPAGYATGPTRATWHLLHAPSSQYMAAYFHAFTMRASMLP